MARGRCPQREFGRELQLMAEYARPKGDGSTTASIFSNTCFTTYQTQDQITALSHIYLLAPARGITNDAFGVYDTRQTLSYARKDPTA